MIWPAPELWRAPVGDWPPAWASSWGSDRWGLWADLVVGGVAQRLRWIEPSGPEGFWMGSTWVERQALANKNLREWAHKSEHEPRRVVVEPGFWLADSPCTQAFWVQVAGGQTNPSQFQQGDEAGERPVECVSWDDVQLWLARMVGLCSATAGLAALPTEVQWEYACRAGSTTGYWWGDGFDQTRANADVPGNRYLDGSERTTTLVKRYAPNPWGLHDMHGNVWEWCEDAWRALLVGGAEADASDRTARGGSWFYHPDGARAAFRSRRPRDYRARSLGFRISLRSLVPEQEGHAR